PLFLTAIMILSRVAAMGKGAPILLRSPDGGRVRSVPFEAWPSKPEFPQARRRCGGRLCEMESDFVRPFHRPCVFSGAAKQRLLRQLKTEETLLVKLLGYSFWDSFHSISNHC